MTKEEAAEIVLGGDAWQPCFVCDGMGEIPERDANFNDIAHHTCVQCSGAGYLPVKEFGEACKVLGREYPKKKMSGLEKKERLKNAFDKFPFKEILAGPSVTRQLFPAYPVKPDDEEP